MEELSLSRKGGGGGWTDESVKKERITSLAAENERGLLQNDL